MLRKPGEDFDDFVRDWSRSLLHTAVLLCGGDRGHGEDLLQTALLRVAARWSSVRIDRVAYARQVLVNLSKDRWRDRGRRVSETELTAAHLDLGEQEPLPSDQVLTRHLLLAATARLPPRQRAVLVLRYFNELSVDQTARALGCSEGTVKSQTHEALAGLRQHLAEAGVTVEEEFSC